jgi:hypothetical protein
MRLISVDLYVDGVSGFSVNKKARTSSSNLIPTNFATVEYARCRFPNDQNRSQFSTSPTFVEC